MGKHGAVASATSRAAQHGTTIAGTRRTDAVEADIQPSEDAEIAVCVVAKAGRTRRDYFTARTLTEATDSNAWRSRLPSGSDSAPTL
jgi:hypothetical protein